MNATNHADIGTSNRSILRTLTALLEHVDGSSELAMETMQILSRAGNAMVDYFVTKDSLAFLLNSNHYTYAEQTDFLNEYEDKSIEEFLYDVFDGNGMFEVIAPEDIGALTSAPIIGMGVDRDEDDNHVKHVDKLFWFPDYAVTDPLHALGSCDIMFFPRVRDESEVEQIKW